MFWEMLWEASENELLILYDWLDKREKKTRSKSLCKLQSSVLVLIFLSLGTGIISTLGQWPIHFRLWIKNECEFLNLTVC